MILGQMLLRRKEKVAMVTQFFIFAIQIITVLRSAIKRLSSTGAETLKMNTPSTFTELATRSCQGQIICQREK